MRFSAVLLAACAIAFAEESRSLDVYKYDANGRRVLVTGGVETSNGGSTKTETARGANGRSVALQSTTDKVLSQSDSYRQVERTIQYNDESGRPVRTERVMIEEQKQPGGGMTVTSTTYRSNVNDGMDLAERSTQVTSKSGDQTTTEVSSERKSINGSFGLAERRTTVVRQSGAITESDSTVFRPDLNGSLKPQEREIVKSEKTPTGMRTDTTVYNAKSSRQAGDALEFATQSVTETVKNADGTESTVTDVYAQSSPGRATSGTKPQLKERLVTERRLTSAGYVDALSVQRPEVADGRLGPPQPVSETVCSGDCGQGAKK